MKSLTSVLLQQTALPAKPSCAHMARQKAPNMKALLNPQAQEQRQLEEALIGHLLFIAMEEVEKIGYEFRLDIRHYVNQASIVPLSKMPPAILALNAKKVDDTATALIRDLSVDDARTLLFSVCQFILTLVDEGYTLDPRSQPVMVSVSLMDEIKDGKVGESLWRLEQQKWTDNAGTLLVRSKLLGFFMTL